MGAVPSTEFHRGKNVIKIRNFDNEEQREISKIIKKTKDKRAKQVVESILMNYSHHEPVPDEVEEELAEERKQDDIANGTYNPNLGNTIYTDEVLWDGTLPKGNKNGMSTQNLQNLTDIEQPAVIKFDFHYQIEPKDYKVILEELQLFKEERCLKIENSVARYRLLSIVNEQIDKLTSEAKYMSQERKSHETLSFNYTKYTHWLENYDEYLVYNLKSEEWQNFFIQNVDYLANSKIIKKNAQVLRLFTKNIMDLKYMEHQEILGELQRKINELKKDCYQVTAHQQALHDVDINVNDKLDVEDYHFNKLVSLIQQSKVVCKPDGIDGQSETISLSKLQGGMPRIDQLNEFPNSHAYSAPRLRQKVNGSMVEKSYFICMHALQYSFQFHLDLKYAMRESNFKVSACRSENLTRIASEIERNPYEAKGPFRVADVLKACITVQEIPSLSKAYQLLSTIEELQVIKVQNRLLSPTERTVVVHVIYADGIVAEVTLRWGEKAANTEAIEFLGDLVAADSTYEFHQTILQWCTSLAASGEIYESFEEEKTGGLEQWAYQTL